MGRPKAGVTNEQRFWAAVEKTDGCWIWHGFRNALGYGRVRWNGPQVLAHRIAYELLVGPIPDGLLILHHCDNPPCGYVGTKLDNSRDMRERGRERHTGQPGETNSRAKLTDAEAEAIRRARPVGHEARSLAAALGVHEATIRRVVAGKTYRRAS